MITIRQKGDFKLTTAFFKRMKEKPYLKVLNKFGEEGVRALSSATPKDSGLTSMSWSYRIEHDKNSTRIVWTNSNVVKGAPIAILLQYGHGTRNGGYVQGRDYINPALRPIFDKIANDAWKEVTRA